MANLFQRLLLLINTGHSRSVKARKNILVSFFIKGVSIIVGFVFVPLLFNSLGAVEYGIWLTLTSILAWVNYFDVGLGNGLRNRFAESLAKGQHEMAQIYVSTTYAGLALIFGGIFLIFLGINPFLSWHEILKAPAGLERELSLLAVVTFGFFLLRFTLKLVTIVLLADQRPAIANVFDPAANVLSLIAVLILIRYSESSLLNLGIVLGLSPVVLLIIATFYFYNREYKPYRPKWRLVNFKYFKDLASLGLRFFIIQITVVIIMMTNNLIITRVVGPEAVASYNIAYKYFGIVVMLFVIITNTYWSAFTEAYVKKDFAWIKKVNKNLVMGWLGILGLLVIMLLLADKFYLLWIGKEIEKIGIPFLLSAMMALFNGVYVWYIIFIYFINGTGKITLQLYISVVVAILNIPISVFLAKYMGMGAAGVVLGSSLTYLPGAIIAPIQYWKIIHQKDYGIWGR